MSKILQDNPEGRGPLKKWKKSENFYHLGNPRFENPLFFQIFFWWRYENFWVIFGWFKGNFWVKTEVGIGYLNKYFIISHWRRFKVRRVSFASLLGWVCPCPCFPLLPISFSRLPPSSFNHSNTSYYHWHKKIAITNCCHVFTKLSSPMGLVTDQCWSDEQK